jgi:hypothetical protein
MSHAVTHYQTGLAQRILMMRSIELIGTEVVPRVHELLTPDVRTAADR